jgi:hypothetical protein
VHFARDVVHVDVKGVCAVRGGSWGGVSVGRWCRLVGIGVCPRLIHVSKMHEYRRREVAAALVGREARPRCKVAGFDGAETGRQEGREEVRIIKSDPVSDEGGRNDSFGLRVREKWGKVIVRVLWPGGHQAVGVPGRGGIW